MRSMTPQNDDNIEALKALNNGNEPDIHFENGIPDYIYSKFTDKVILSGGDAIDALNSVKSLYQIKNPKKA